MIHSDSVHDVYTKNKIPLWLISAFKAGFINSAGFLITGKYVSHITGFGTQVGMAIGHQDYFFGFELLVIPISFIFGGILTSLLLDAPTQKGQYPPYWRAQGIITLLLFLVIVLAETLYKSGATFPLNHGHHLKGLELLLLSFLCLACGLKNALVTWSTFGKIRVTHLTGISTDIGLNFLQTLFPHRKSERFKEERFVNILRIMTWIFFSLGALISAVLYAKIGHKGLFIPMVISIGMSIVSILDSKKINSEVEDQNAVTIRP